MEILARLAKLEAGVSCGDWHLAPPSAVLKHIRHVRCWLACSYVSTPRLENKLLLLSNNLESYETEYVHFGVACWRCFPVTASPCLTGELGCIRRQGCQRHGDWLAGTDHGPARGES